MDRRKADRRTDGWTDRFLYVLQDFVPFEAAALLPLNLNHVLLKQGMGTADHLLPLGCYCKYLLGAKNLSSSVHCFVNYRPGWEVVASICSDRITIQAYTKHIFNERYYCSTHLDHAFSFQEVNLILIIWVLPIAILKSIPLPYFCCIKKKILLNNVFLILFYLCFVLKVPRDITEITKILCSCVAKKNNYLF